MDTSIEDKVNLICCNLQEIQGKDILEKIVAARPLNVYWGTAPTGRIHIGYFVPMLKIADFLKAGCNVTILIADLHAYLDNMKSNLKQLESRKKYYEYMIKEMLKVLNVSIDKLNFIYGTEYQLDSMYTFDVYRLNALTTVNNAKHSGAEVVKSSDNPLLSSLQYSILQALDEVYLKADAQFGGIDQRKIFMYARTMLPKLENNTCDKTLKYHKRIHLMNELVPGITNQKKDTKDEFNIDSKMSASNEKSKIDLLDGNGVIRKKIKSAYCVPNDIEDNCLMVILEKILFRIMVHRNDTFKIKRKEEYGGDIEFINIDTVKEEFETGNIHPDDFKNGIYAYIIEIFSPIKEAFDTKDMKTLLSNSY